MNSKIVICIVLAILFTGCAKTDLTKIDLDAMKQQQKAVTACYEARKIDLKGVPKDSIGYIIMAQQLVSALGNDPCKSTNAFDVQIAEVNAKNRALSSATGNVINLGQWIVGGSVAKAAFGAMGDTVTASDSASASMSSTANNESYNTATETRESYNTQETTASGTSMDDY
jgi:hypothetical protein